MKAAQIEKYGSPRVIAVNEIAVPLISPDQVLVRVYSSSINPIDTILREGYLRKSVPLSLPCTLGYDVAGIAMEIGSAVKGIMQGDHVFGQASILAGASGAFAEVAAVPSQLLGRIPAALSYGQAAACSLAGLSALQALKDHLQLRSSQRILIHGGSGGIGSIAIQMARAMGAHVASTATGKGIDFVRHLGADEVIDYREQWFTKVLSDYDAVLDTQGGRIYKKSYKILREGGTIVSLHEHPKKRLSKKYGVHATYLGTQTTPRHLSELAECIQRNHIHIPIDRTFPLEQIREAFEAKEREQILGKIVIEIRNES
ncbi:MAG TPA: NADP-dependent oxidoreductase [Bacteroidota bacterium]|nr:NADP-dependent oxidoreductase [Bacteroidota bacterium]